MITTKNFLSALLLSLTTTFFLLPTHEICASCTKSTTPTDKQIVKHIGAILNVLNIPYKPNITSITSVAVKLWKRQPGQERWEQDNIHLTHQKLDKINTDLQKLGFISAVSPPRRKHFSSVLIFGARVGGMKLRLEYAYKLIREKNLKVDSIVILAGERLLTTVHGKHEIDIIKNDLKSAEYTKNLSKIKTEADAAKLLLKIIPRPVQVKQGAHVVSTGPVLDKRTGEIRRADTRDTLRTWMNEYKTSQIKSPYKKYSLFKRAHILLVSSQPFILYQGTVTESVLKDSHIQFTVIGPSCSKETRLIEKLNAVASWLENRERSFN